ncbi:MAG: response regulator [Myxococcales bacterium]|nr:response regulator [Myxococcales bacterium]
MATEPHAAKLLIVDDEPTNVAVVKALLEHAGFECEVAADGEQAIERLRGGHGFAAVLMDLQMPKLDGFAATERLRFEEARDGRERVPVFAMTAHSVPDAQQRVEDTGMDGMLTKPVRLAVLLSSLARVGVARPGAAPEPGRESLVPRGHVLDRATIERLKRMQNDKRPTFLADLFTRFDHSAGELRERLKQAIGAGDDGATREAAHALKGASRNVGASRLSGLCADLEQLADAGGAIDGFLPSIERELDRVLDALRAELD